MGKFIVFEGADGSGKSTQTSLLKEYLEQKGYTVIMLDFPRYEESHFGALVRKLLDGKFGEFEKVNPYLAVLPYMIDQALMAPQIQEWLDKGWFVLSDRYFTSNFGHQLAKFSNAKERDEMREWLMKAGYGELRILKQDLVLMCDVDPKISQGLMKARKSTKKGSMDAAERNKKHQRDSYKNFVEMTTLYPEWIRVPCVGQAKMLSPQEIHGHILTILGI
jgi:dTMP kinase